MLLAGWIVIVVLTIYESSFVNAFSSSLQLLASFIIKIGITIVNAAVPALTMKLSVLECWDNPAFDLKTQLLRIYLAKILNVVLFALINMQFARDELFINYGESQADFKDNLYNYRENQVSILSSVDGVPQRRMN
jgi:hypothetical protein